MKFYDLRQRFFAIFIICCYPSVINGLAVSNHKALMKKIASLSTFLLLSGSSIVSADNSRIVGDMTTSGIVFKDTLKITGSAFKLSFQTIDITACYQPRL